MDLHVSIKPETLFSVGPFDFTNAFLTMLLVMGFLLILGIYVARNLTLVPTGGQSVFELTAEFILGLVESSAGKSTGRRIFPLIGGLFIFIIISNYSGLLPGVGTVGINETHSEAEEALTASVESPYESQPIAAAEEGEEEVLVPFLRSPSADLNMTLAMAVVVFVVVQYAGVAAHGVGGRIRHMADPWWIFPIELISELSRIISLSFRLFGNVFAGEVLIAVMIAFGAATYLVLTPLTTVFTLFEVLVGFIQALVFALLTLIYISLAVGEEHGE